jgi:DNA-binding Lrp family transcriptional regulator
MYKLNYIDTLILRQLLRNGRKSFAEIAKETNSSKDIIWNHYTKMEKAGVIVGATTQFNYQKFGYTGIALMQLSTELQYTEEVIESISKITKLRVFKQFNSPYNIGVMVLLKELKDVERMSQYINNKNPIKELRTFIWTDLRTTPENLIIEKPEKTINKFKENNKNIKIDHIDAKIVEELTKNGRLPFSEIAKNIGSSTGTVNRRFERLIKNGYISIVLQINPLKLGYKCNLSVTLQLTDQNKLMEVADELSAIPGLSFLIKVSGTRDLYFVALVKTVEDVIAINELISKIHYIKRIDGWFSRAISCWPGPKQSTTTF